MIAPPPPPPPLPPGHNGILSHGQHVASSGMNIVKEGYRELGIGRELFMNVMEVRGCVLVANKCKSIS